MNFVEFVLIHTVYILYNDWDRLWHDGTIVHNLDWWNFPLDKHCTCIKADRYVYHAEYNTHWLCLTILCAIAYRMVAHTNLKYMNMCLLIYIIMKHYFGTDIINLNKSFVFYHVIRVFKCYMINMIKQFNLC